MKNRNIEIKRNVKRFLLIVMASIIMAANIKILVRSGGLFPGGFTGITVLLQQIFKKYFDIGLSFSVVNISLNAIPIMISYKTIGKKFTLYSCLMIVLTALFTDLLPSFAITHDILLTSVFGGIISGCAISLCLFADATSGGVDFIAIFLSEKYGIDSWNYILLGNAGILMIAGALFGWDKALYSIIFQFTSTQIIHGWYKRYHKNTLLIITDSPEEIIRTIYIHTGHGATIINGIGSHNKQDRTLVYSVIGSDEVKKVVSKMKEVDEDVFINIIKTEHLNGNFYLKPND